MPVPYDAVILDGWADRYHQSKPDRKYNSSYHILKA